LGDILTENISENKKDLLFSFSFLKETASISRGRREKNLFSRILTETLKKRNFDNDKHIKRTLYTDS